MLQVEKGREEFDPLGALQRPDLLGRIKDDRLLRLIVLEAVGRSQVRVGRVDLRLERVGRIALVGHEGGDAGGRGGIAVEQFLEALSDGVSRHGKEAVRDAQRVETAVEDLQVGQGDGLSSGDALERDFEFLAGEAGGQEHRRVGRDGGAALVEDVLLLGAQVVDDLVGVEVVDGEAVRVRDGGLGGMGWRRLGWGGEDMSGGKGSDCRDRLLLRWLGQVI